MSEETALDPSEVSPRVSDINIHLVNNKLQITAEVDLLGLVTLQQVLRKCDEIIKILEEEDLVQGKSPVKP